MQVDISVLLLNTVTSDSQDLFNCGASAHSQKLASSIDETDYVDNI